MGSWNVTSERIFAQASDPGAVGAGSIWTDTDANISYRRNDANTGWIPFALDLGTAYQNLSVNSGATAQAYQASIQSLLTAQGDVIYASAANTPARLAKGTSGQYLQIGATIPAWADVSTPLVVLDNHIASGAEASYTYTPGTALSFTTYSKIIVEIDMSATASFILQAVLNGVGGTVNYSWGERMAVAPSVTAITPASGAAELVLGTATLIAAADNSFGGRFQIYSVLAAGGVGIIAGDSFLTEQVNANAEILAHKTDIDIDEISSIKLQTSTSTWKANSRITIYGVKRA